MRRHGTTAPIVGTLQAAQLVVSALALAAVACGAPEAGSSDAAVATDRGAAPDAAPTPDVSEMLQDLCRDQGYEVRDCGELPSTFYGRDPIAVYCGGLVQNLRIFGVPSQDVEPAPCWYCACGEGTWWVPFLGCIPCAGPVDCESLVAHARLVRACREDSDCLWRSPWHQCGECRYPFSRYLASGDMDALAQAIALGACEALEVICEVCQPSFISGPRSVVCDDGRCAPAPVPDPG